MKKFAALFSLMYCGSLYGEMTSHGDWVADTDEASNGYIYAATVNADDYLLGLYCYLEQDQCIYVLMFDTFCEEDSDSYIGLANSELDARTVNFRCLGSSDNGLYLYAFQDFDSIEEIVLKARRVGIAFPLDDDRFKVIRFSLIGSNEAIEDMRRFYQDLESGENGSSSTSSQYL